MTRIGRWRWAILPARLDQVAIDALAVSEGKDRNRTVRVTRRTPSSIDHASWPVVTQQMIMYGTFFDRMYDRIDPEDHRSIIPRLLRSSCVCQLYRRRRNWCGAHGRWMTTAAEADGEAIPSCPLERDVLDGWRTRIGGCKKNLCSVFTSGLSQSSCSFGAHQTPSSRFIRTR